MKDPLVRDVDAHGSANDARYIKAKRTHRDAVSFGGDVVDRPSEGLLRPF
jgi:hypothetical protein